MVEFDDFRLAEINFEADFLFPVFQDRGVSFKFVDSVNFVFAGVDDRIFVGNGNVADKQCSNGDE